MRSTDVSNAPGVCASLFVQGCSRHCKGCFNTDTWDSHKGEIWNRRCHTQFIDVCKRNIVKNVCILGGEPLEQDSDLIKLIDAIKDEVKKPIWLWTGYTFEEIYLDESKQYDFDAIFKRCLLKNVDILVDGPYIEELADKNLSYRGSSNQRILDLHESIRQGTPVLAKQFYND